MIGGFRSIKIGVLAKVLIITWVCHVMMRCFRPINIDVLATLLSTVSAQRGEERTAQRRREQSVVRERERQSEREEERERERETEKDIVSTKRSSPPLALLFFGTSADLRALFVQAAGPSARHCRQPRRAITS